MNTPIAVGSNPFSRRMVLAVVVLGACLFLSLLWMIGSGQGLDDGPDLKSHAEAKGLHGYVAMAEYLDARGFKVQRASVAEALDDAGLLVLTPPFKADGKQLTKIVDARRYIGPTMVVLPKWQVQEPRSKDRSAKRGWVRLGGVGAPQWEGFLDTLSISVTEDARPQTWKIQELSGQLSSKTMHSGGGTELVPLVLSGDGKKILAGFMDDGGQYPALEKLTDERVLNTGKDPRRFPTIVVFEADLLNNYGMSRFKNAVLAETLVRAGGLEYGDSVVFDMTLTSSVRSANLLTLLLSPPVLAGTLCLLMAAFLAGWRSLVRFGAPVQMERSIAFGKRALIANSANLIERSGRWHLLAMPYANRARSRLVHALALQRGLSEDAADQAIDRVLQTRHPDAALFSETIQTLKAATRSHDLLKAARELHALERLLIR